MIGRIIQKTASFLLICLLVLHSSGCGGEKIAYAPGEIAGAGFEGEGLSEYWYVTQTGNAVCVDAAAAYEGNHSLKLGAAEIYSVCVTQYISGLEPGYYALEVWARNEGDQECCFVYGKGTSQGKCMTAVPVTAHTDEWTKVTVRGIEVGGNGILEIGIRAEGEGQFASFDRLSLRYEKDQQKQYESLFGGAVSWLDWVEDMGGCYYDADGVEADALQIMAENGCNFVRLELYNNPGDYISGEGDTLPAGYKDADAIFNLAVRAHNKGMKIQLSFMYSDYWGNSAIPSDWLTAIEGVEEEAERTRILAECIYEYTKSFMQRLADGGIYPEYVSLGNEMEGGILTPYGQTAPDDGGISAFCAFMDAGWRAVKEVSPDSQVVLHISCNADDMHWENKSGTGKWFFELCREYGIAYDVIGISFYPFWAQTDSEYAVKKALNTGDLVQWCDRMAEEFDRDILIMETGYNWGTPGQLANNGAYASSYPSTPEGQRDFVIELINAVKCVRDGRCVGVLYWDPVLVRQPGVGYAIVSATGEARANVVETTTFFDYDHKALPVLDAYQFNVTGTDRAVLYGTVTDQSGKPLAETAATLRFGGSDYVILTDGYGGYFVFIRPGEGELSVNGREVRRITAAAGDQVRCDLTIQ